MAKLTQQDIDYIKKLGGKIPDYKIAKTLGVTRGCIQYHRDRLGIPPCNKIIYSNAMDEFIRKHYRRDMTRENLANHFGFSYAAISHRIRILGLTNDASRNKPDTRRRKKSA